MILSTITKSLKLKATTIPKPLQIIAEETNVYYCSLPKEKLLVSGICPSRLLTVPYFLCEIVDVSC